VPVRAISRLRKRLVGLTLSQRLKIQNLDPKRADLAPVGAVLLDTILDGIGAEELTLCDFALREGLIYDYIARNPRHIRSVERYPDVRRRSVIELAERFNYLPDHARQIAALSLALFDATRPRHGLGAREREWLEYGALLHDIGTHIGYERHHRHSHYLIRHGGLRGFEPDEVEWIALIARYHRQGVPKKSHPELEGFSREDRKAVAALSAMVRLAEGLDRSHAQAVGSVHVVLRGRRLSIQLRASGDVDLELWAAGRHATALADALDVEVTIGRVQPRRRKAIRRPRRPAARPGRERRRSA
jgi:exopolyphosphatase/guanosine-5'-triphosphate,3'-diphosphate pyrophosphatase